MFAYEDKIQHWVNRLSYQLRAEALRGFKAAELDLSAEEWALLMILWGDGATTMNHLAAKTLKDRTTVTRMVDRMVRKELLVRRADESDRRVVQIDVTSKANKMKKRIMGVVLPLIERSVAGVSEKDMRTTVSTLKRMSENLE